MNERDGQARREDTVTDTSGPASLVTMNVPNEEPPRWTRCSCAGRKMSRLAGRAVTAFGSVDEVDGGQGGPAWEAARDKMQPGGEPLQGVAGQCMQVTVRDLHACKRPKDSLIGPDRSIAAGLQLPEGSGDPEAQHACNQRLEARSVLCGPTNHPQTPPHCTWVQCVYGSV